MYEEYNKYMNEEEMYRLMDVLSTEFEEFNFSVRTYNVLKDEGIDTIGELALIPIEKIKKFKKIGKKSIREIEDKLEEIFSFRKFFNRLGLDEYNIKKKIQTFLEEKKEKEEEEYD